MIVLRWFGRAIFGALTLAAPAVAPAVAAEVALDVAPAVAAPAFAAAPERVVSMNLCTDQLAMLLAAPGQLRAVSGLAADPIASAMAERARGYPLHSGQAEEIFLMRPDLVIAGVYTTRATVDMLRRLGVEVVEFAPARSFDDVRARVREMGAVLGRDAQAARLIARFDADLAAARAARAQRPLTALYNANNYTLGGGTLAHSVVDAAGLANLAAELGYEGGARLPLERLVVETPELIVTGRDEAGVALAEEALAHPVLEALRESAGQAPVADRNWVCGTPFITAAVRRLAAARDAMLARP